MKTLSCFARRLSTSSSPLASFLYLQQEDQVKAGGYDMNGTIKATERSFYLHGKGDYIMPSMVERFISSLNFSLGKPVIRWGGPETEETTGRIMSMPSYLGGKDFEKELEEMELLGPVNTSGIKFIPSRPHNPVKYGLPRASAIIIILDEDTLFPKCVMEGSLVSAMRTGAASGVAAKYLAREGSQVMGLIGASVQGITQSLAIKTAVDSIESIKVFDINEVTSQKFVERMSEELEDVEFTIVECAEEAIRDSDIVSTATMAKEPYVSSEWYKEGVLHCEISFWDTPPSALKDFDFLVVDDWDQVKHHGVDVAFRSVRDGIVPMERVRGNLGEIVVGDKVGRESDDQKIFFNPIGLGIHDLSEAFRVFKNALEMDIGKELSLFDEPFLGF